ncbi:hypothetical protein HOC13_04045 [Candidatus Woesearchaeota archaeon]|jgi:hypothetical protein|nr:hypothetical protein [Candidatus Woesearchaeota archaeon]
MKKKYDRWIISISILFLIVVVGLNLFYGHSNITGAAEVALEGIGDINVSIWLWAGISVLVIIVAGIIATVLGRKALPEKGRR